LGDQPRKKAIRRLYTRCPPRTAVICFDEWGPLELKPLGGTAWAARGKPRRMRATYRRLQGVRHFLGFYDVHHRLPRRAVPAAQAYPRPVGGLPPPAPLVSAAAAARRDG
jgi:hypothetical protein